MAAENPLSPTSLRSLPSAARGAAAALDADLLAADVAPLTARSLEAPASPAAPGASSDDADSGSDDECDFYRDYLPNAFTYIDKYDPETEEDSETTHIIYLSYDWSSSYRMEKLINTIKSSTYQFELIISCSTLLLSPCKEVWELLMLEKIFSIKIQLKEMFVSLKGVSLLLLNQDGYDFDEDQEGALLRVHQYSADNDNDGLFLAAYKKALDVFEKIFLHLHKKITKINISVFLLNESCRNAIENFISISRVVVSLPKDRMEEINIHIREFSLHFFNLHDGDNNPIIPDGVRPILSLDKPFNDLARLFLPCVNLQILEWNDCRLNTVATAFRGLEEILIKHGSLKTLKLGDNVQMTDPLLEAIKGSKIKELHISNPRLPLKAAAVIGSHPFLDILELPHVEYEFASQFRAAANKMIEKNRGRHYLDCLRIQDLSMSNRGLMSDSKTRQSLRGYFPHSQSLGSECFVESLFIALSVDPATWTYNPASMDAVCNLLYCGIPRTNFGPRWDVQGPTLRKLELGTYLGIELFGFKPNPEDARRLARAIRSNNDLRIVAFTGVNRKEYDAENRLETRDVGRREWINNFITALLYEQPNPSPYLISVELPYVNYDIRRARSEPFELDKHLFKNKMRFLIASLGIFTLPDGVVDHIFSFLSAGEGRFINDFHKVYAGSSYKPKEPNATFIKKVTEKYLKNMSENLILLAPKSKDADAKKTPITFPSFLEHLMGPRITEPTPAAKENTASISERGAIGGVKRAGSDHGPKVENTAKRIRP